MHKARITIAVTATGRADELKAVVEALGIERDLLASLCVGRAADSSDEV